ncbi:3-phenylpropionate/trans-cinnamate dioxygenase ferredoxin reductase subunit [Haloactinopolyspora alba]|uniref:3-phenylpropionate/trans-cinnamate dioxygenase ferredoxin reductase subunit n=1 Tax=Haloactinopolyspora alba TaxID=648780 RepID=A0A2P8E508_9ACTN|nr:FAD-dependent oxidoreductase [Haloactinopolyspora alba]PSL04558.1 3-phenylpropionate/trans-cinnamate dioxygenase ferredoxin reductase subunit [Haloactinopolyspora alba]
MAERPFVVVGAGLAGAKTVEELREQGFDGPIMLVGDEPERPYERPPLSKECLAGSATLDSAYVHAPDWYAAHDVDLRLETPVTRIDRAVHQIETVDGVRHDYAKLLLATGSAPRPLPVPGGDATGVHYLRRMDDSRRIKDTIGSVAHLLVVGGGWIGLEVASAARGAGVDVTVVEALPLPLQQPLGPELARVFADLHLEHGVTLRTGVTVERVVVAGDVAVGARLSDGSEIEAEAVVVGVGAAPNVGLATAAGLEVADGVVADAGLRTSDPDIVVAGDVAEATHPLLGRRVRVEHWANALNQPATAAATMLGADVRYEELPYFFTDQYDLGMEYHGDIGPDGYDDVVVRGDSDGREFVAFWLRDRRVLAGMNVNVWDVGEAVKALIRSGVQVDPRRLADLDVPLPTS